MSGLLIERSRGFWSNVEAWYEHRVKLAERGQAVDDKRRAGIAIVCTVSTVSVLVGLIPFTLFVTSIVVLNRHHFVPLTISTITLGVFLALPAVFTPLWGGLLRSPLATYFGLVDPPPHEPSEQPLEAKHECDHCHKVIDLDAPWYWPNERRTLTPTGSGPYHLRDGVGHLFAAVHRPHEPRPDAVICGWCLERVYPLTEKRLRASVPCGSPLDPNRSSYHGAGQAGTVEIDIEDWTPRKDPNPEAVLAACHIAIPLTDDSRDFLASMEVKDGVEMALDHELMEIAQEKVRLEKQRQVELEHQANRERVEAWFKQLSASEQVAALIKQKIDEHKSEAELRATVKGQLEAFKLIDPEFPAVDLEEMVDVLLDQQLRQ